MMPHFCLFARAKTWLAKTLYYTQNPGVEYQSVAGAKKLANERVESCFPYLDICSIGTTTTAAGTLHPETVACVAYPRSAYEGTNFGGAAFSVSEVPDARTESQCLQFDKFTIDKKTVHWETIHIRARVSTNQLTGS
jgi:hypothetical protein